MIEFFSGSSSGCLILDIRPLGHHPRQRPLNDITTRRKDLRTYPGIPFGSRNMTYITVDILVLCDRCLRILRYSQSPESRFWMFDIEIVSGYICVCQHANSLPTIGISGLIMHNHACQIALFFLSKPFLTPFTSKYQDATRDYSFLRYLQNLDCSSA